MNRLYDFNNDHECGVEIQPSAFSGGFLNEPLVMFRVLRLAALGQSALCTPAGLANLWGVEKRLIGKIVSTLKPSVDVVGDGYVRLLEVSNTVAISQRATGYTADLGMSAQIGWNLPDGPVSHWRGRGLSQKNRKAVFTRDGEVCAYCKTTEGPFHIDHVKPVAKGGSDELENLCVACAGCNIAKSDMALAAFLKTRREQ